MRECAVWTSTLPNVKVICFKAGTNFCEEICWTNFMVKCHWKIPLELWPQTPLRELAVWTLTFQRKSNLFQNLLSEISVKHDWEKPNGIEAPTATFSPPRLVGGSCRRTPEPENTWIGIRVTCDRGRTLWWDNLRCELPRCRTWELFVSKLKQNYVKKFGGQLSFGRLNESDRGLPGGVYAKGHHVLNVSNRMKQTNLKLVPATCAKGAWERFRVEFD